MIETCETCARSFEGAAWAEGPAVRCPYCRIAIGAAARPSKSIDADFDAPLAPRHGVRLKRALQVLAATLAFTGATAAVADRDAVVRAAPHTARLFAAIGLPVNLRGLALEAVQANLSNDDGKRMLTVEGAIVNLRHVTTEPPPMRIALRDAAQHEIYAWTAKALTAKLGPGERATFRTRLAAPPQGARDIVVRFASASASATPIEGEP